jgi:hypothetical protein
MRRTAFRPHAAQPSSEVLETSQLERLLDQLVLVFQDVASDPPGAVGRPFAAGLPRYELKTKSIFPEAGKMAPEDDGAPVRASAQLRTFLNEAADQSSPSRTWAAAACLRMLEASVGRSLAVRALPAMASAPGREPAGTLAELREALERLLRAELGASSRPAR